MKDYSEICTKYLDELLKKINCVPIKGADLEHTILRTLIGTSRTTRLGPMPSAETNKEILNRIHEKVKQNSPLEVTSAWGAIKTIPSKDKGVDLAELLTLKQFHAISNAIKKIYPPGIRFNIFLGDSYYSYLYGFDSQINNYYEGMKLLTKEYKEVNLIRLSELCKDLDFIKQQCQNNYELLRKYWFETSKISPELYDKTSSFRDLQEAGWIGTITPVMREFYLKRMTKLYPNESVEFRIDKIIHFFAYGLMISQNDLMGRKKAETSTVDACLLRVPPPDLPRKLYSNRLRLRIVPESIAQSSAPPWTVAGTIDINDNEELRTHFIDINAYKMTKLEEFNYGNIKIGISKSENVK